MLYLHQLTE